MDTAVAKKSGKKLLIDPALDAKYRAMKPPCTRCMIDKYTRFRYFNNKNALLSKGKEPQARFACRSPQCLAAFPEKDEVEFTFDGKIRPAYSSKNKKKRTAAAKEEEDSLTGCATSTSSSATKRSRKGASPSLPFKQKQQQQQQVNLDSSSYAPPTAARNIHSNHSSVDVVVNLGMPAAAVHSNNNRMTMMAANDDVALGTPAVHNNMVMALGVPAYGSAAPLHMSSMRGTSMPVTYPPSHAAAAAIAASSSKLPLASPLAMGSDDDMDTDTLNKQQQDLGGLDNIDDILMEEQNLDDEFALADLLWGGTTTATITDSHGHEEEAEELAAAVAMVPEAEWKEELDPLTALLLEEEREPWITNWGLQDDDEPHGYTVEWMSEEIMVHHQEEEQQQKKKKKTTSMAMATATAATVSSTDDELMRWLMPI